MTSSILAQRQQELLDSQREFQELSKVMEMAMAEEKEAAEREALAASSDALANANQLLHQSTRIAELESILTAKEHEIKGWEEFTAELQQELKDRSKVLQDIKAKQEEARLRHKREMKQLTDHITAQARAQSSLGSHDTSAGAKTSSTARLAEARKRKESPALVEDVATTLHQLKPISSQKNQPKRHKQAHAWLDSDLESQDTGDFLASVGVRKKK